MKKKLMAALAAGALAVIPASAAMADGHENGEIIAVHAIDDAFFEAALGAASDVDVYVAGSYDEPLFSFAFGETETLSVPAGSYDLEIYPAGGDTSADPVLAATAAVGAGESISVVAHFTSPDADGIAVTGFANENSEEGAQIFHTAAFGPVDIIALGEPTGVTLSLGDDAFLPVDPGTTLTDTGAAVSGETDIALPVPEVTTDEGLVYLVYAVGSASGESLTLAIATTDVVAEEVDEDAEEEAEEEVEQPTHVDSGTGGLLDAGLPVWVAALMVMGALGIAAPAVATARRRS